MATHQFRLVMQGALDDEGIDRLFEAGCGDATFSTKDDRTFGDFAREADTVGDAIGSAANAVTSAGFQVIYIDLDNLVWASEIAERTGFSQELIDLFINEERGPGDFPPPVSHSTRNPLWRWSDVEAWFNRYQIDHYYEITE